MNRSRSSIRTGFACGALRNENFANCVRRGCSRPAKIVHAQRSNPRSSLAEALGGRGSGANCAEAIASATGAPIRGTLLVL